MRAVQIYEQAEYLGFDFQTFIAIAEVKLTGPFQLGIYPSTNWLSVLNF